MQEINAWLQSDQNFASGVALYIEHGTNTFFKDLLKSAGPTPYNIQKLSTELTKLGLASPANPEIPTIPEIPNNPDQESTSKTPPSQVSPAPAPRGNPADHALYLRYLDRRDTVVRQLDRNMAALDFTNDKAVNYQTAQQILRLHQIKQELWSKIDYYQAHGSFEPVHVPEPPSREKKMQLIYQSISKARKRLADPNCKNREKTEQLIEEKLQELEAIKGGTDAD